MNELTKPRKVKVEIFSAPITDEIGAAKTGAWRTTKPIWNSELCKPCNICGKYCPEGIIIVTKENGIQIDYDYCKGCGICAYECPRGAIEMVEE